MKTFLDWLIVFGVYAITLLCGLGAALVLAFVFAACHFYLRSWFKS